MEGFKQCPECQCTDVPTNAQVCPFCGHPLEVRPRPQPKGMQNRPGVEPVVVQNQMNSKPQMVQNRTDSNPTVRPEEKKPAAPVTVTDKGGSGTKKAPAPPQSTDYKAYQKKEKKKHGFLKFLVVAAVVAFVWVKFLKPSGDEGSSLPSGGLSEGYSESPESTEPESQMADAGDGMYDGEDDWTNGDMEGEESQGAESLEMGSEEMPLEDGLEVNPQFILPLSDQVYLTREDIEGLSAEELRIARNEIYARHGRLFRDEGLQAYFNSCDWYVGTISADDFTDSVFNEYERANKDLIVSYEHELGVNGQ